MCETWNRLDEDFERLIGRLEIVASASEPGMEIRSSARLTAGGEAAVIELAADASGEEVASVRAACGNGEDIAANEISAGGASSQQFGDVVCLPPPVGRDGAGCVQPAEIYPDSEVLDFKIARLPPPRVRRSDGAILGNAPAEGSIRPISCRAG